MRRRLASCVWRHKQAVVESQPTVDKTVVSGDPHEEGFDFGPHGGIAGQQQLDDVNATIKGGEVQGRETNEQEIR